jgi:hypothetical protein
MNFRGENAALRGESVGLMMRLLYDTFPPEINHAERRQI